MGQWAHACNVGVRLLATLCSAIAGKPCPHRLHAQPSTNMLTSMQIPGYLAPTAGAKEADAAIKTLLGNLEEAYYKETAVR